MLHSAPLTVNLMQVKFTAAGGTRRKVRGSPQLPSVAIYVAVFQLVIKLLTLHTPDYQTVSLCVVEGEPAGFASVSEPAGAAQPGQTLLAAQRHAGTPLGPGSSHCQHHW